MPCGCGARDCGACYGSAAIMIVPCANDECPNLVESGYGLEDTGYCEPCDDARADAAACGERRDDD